MTAFPAQYDVYLAYKVDDREIVMELERELAALGLSVWRDVISKEPTRDWPHTIEEGRVHTPFVAICVGQSGVAPGELEEFVTVVGGTWADPQLRLAAVLLPGADEVLASELLSSGLQLLDLRSGVRAGRDVLRRFSAGASLAAPSMPRASPSVEGAAARLSGEVTAAAFVRELLSSHPEYGDKRARSVALDIDAGDRAEPVEWLERVAEMLAPGASTEIHGRLLLAALARLEPTLRQQLERDDFLATVEREISEPLDTLLRDAYADPPARSAPPPLPGGPAAASARPRVFMNYAATSSADTRAARELGAGLREHGVEPWLLPDVVTARDTPELSWESTADAIKSSDGFVICVGTGSLRERGRRELALAVDRVERDPTYRVATALLPGPRPVNLDEVEELFPHLPSFDIRLGLSAIRALADFLRQGVQREDAVDDGAAAAAVGGFELAGGYARDAVDPTRAIPLDDDRLGVRDDVKMLASLIADAATPMPLSIGLFGEWGSGKSTFMGLLRGQVDELQGKPGYHADIHQIGFNAWHYADTNLWASLGHEIFEQLAGAGNTAEQQREAIKQQLTERLHARTELEDATARATAETVRLRGQIEATADENASSARAMARATVSTVAGSDLAKAWKRLGIDDEVEQGRRLAAEMRGSIDEYDALRSTVSRIPRRALLIASAVVMVATGSALLFERSMADAGLAAAGTAIGSMLLIASRIRSGLITLRTAAEKLKNELDSGKVKAVAAELEALRRAEASRDVLQSQLDEVVAHAGALGRELAELSPGRRLYSFVNERAEGESYRRHLGLISTVRRDFEQLIVLMDDWKTYAKADGDQESEATPLPIDRIVLYIDDLDRCSPKQVVDVLQAVHLLLALELFVVVVGVDPRWLLRSLQNQYDELLTSIGDGTSGDDWQVSPHDYLEKIFNIPFALPHMTPASFENLLDSLAREKDVDPGPGGTEQRQTREPAGGGDAERTDVAEGGSGLDDAKLPLDQRVADATIEAEAGSLIDLTARGEQTPAEVRQLTVDEREMLTALGTLVSTPREAKRLVNLYRMIRATRDLDIAAQFLGSQHTAGDHQAVIILLGLLSGHGPLLEPVLAAKPGDEKSRVLGGLLHREESSTWGDFVTGMEPKLVEGEWRNAIVGPLAASDVPAWRRLHGGLAKATAMVTLRDMRAFQTWGPRVARFSFFLSSYSGDDELLAPSS